MTVIQKQPHLRGCFINMYIHIFLICILDKNLNAEKNLDKILKLKRKNRFSSRGHVEEEKEKYGDISKRRTRRKRKKVKQIERRGRLIPSL